MVKSTKHLSPIITVRADTPLAQVVRKMRDENVGAVLVESDNWLGELVGIFSERDLLKYIDEIQHRDYWERPVSTVMSRPVKTISAAEMMHAGDVMLKHGFRHLPVVTKDHDGKPHLVAIISMRDLYRDLLRTWRDSPSGQKYYAHQPGKFPSYRIGVFSKDARFVQFVKEGLLTFRQLSIKRLSARSGASPMKILADFNALDGLFFDLDKRALADWAGLLRSFNSARKSQRVFIVYTPALHSPHELRIVDKLQYSDRISVFTKPVNAGALFREINQYFSSL